MQLSFGSAKSYNHLGPVQGFDYNFSAIHDETNELLLAFKDMFEIAVSQGTGLWDIVIVYLPFLERVFVSSDYLTT